VRKVLWIGDAACDSGFSKCTHQTLPSIIEAGWDVAVLGLNYRGFPHTYPYRIYPASVKGDLLGTRVLHEVIGLEKPDLVVIQNDPWNVPHYVAKLNELKQRPITVGAMAVDGLNPPGRMMNGLDHVVFWTSFGQQESERSGFIKPSSIVPLGVDLSIYTPGDKVAARQSLGLPEFTQRGFWVLNVNRNQPRKRLDLSIQYFSEWMHSRGVRDAFLYFHVCPTGDVGIDCDQLAGYYNLARHFILAEPEVYRGASEAHLVQTYRAADVQINTASGEGWGLTTMEGMACGVPQIVPDWAALGEWAAPAAHLIKCDAQSVTWGGPNVIGGVPNKWEFIEALDGMYREHQARENYRQAGLALVERPEYRWDSIGRAFAQTLEGVWARREEFVG
jgi:D-inositol-3-phosphate glycosyltransferase